MGILDEMFVEKEREDQALLNDQCDLATCKEMYRNGEIDLIEFMERTTKTPEYKRLKGSYCEGTN